MKNFHKFLCRVRTELPPNNLNKNQNKLFQGEYLTSYLVFQATPLMT
jgi:hypothetical protein